MTLAAAPRAAASPRRAATFRSLDALTLLRPASASAAPTSSRHASTHLSGTSDAARAAARIATDRTARSASVSLGSLRRGSKPGIRRRVLIGQLQEPTVQTTTGRGGPGVQVRVLRVARASLGQRRNHRDERRTEAGGDGRCAATTGDGLGRGEAIDEGAQGQVGERRSRGFVHGLIVGGVRRPGTAGVMPRPDERRRRERARYRRARSRGPTCPASRGRGPPPVGNVRCRMAPCQAARV